MEVESGVVGSIPSVHIGVATLVLELVELGEEVHDCRLRTNACQPASINELSTLCYTPPCSSRLFYKPAL